MKYKTQIQITAYVVAAAYSIVILIAGLQLPHLALKILSVLPVVIVLGFGGFEKLLWRVWPCRLVSRSRPRLRGTWRGALVGCLAEDGKIRQRDPIDVLIVIRQSYSDVSVMLLTKESTSRSVVSSIIRNGEGDFSLCYQYQNKPGLQVRVRSPIHFGGAAIEASGFAPTRLVGEYWTDRQTWGTFEVTWESKNLVAEFTEGKTK